MRDEGITCTASMYVMYRRCEICRRCEMSCPADVQFLAWFFPARMGRVCVLFNCIY